MHDRPIGPGDVGRVLRAAGVPYVVVGAHAANGYTGRPRATVDVDVIVKHPKKAARAVAEAFPELQMEDTPVVTRFKDQDHEAIDLMKPVGSKLWPQLIKASREIRLGGDSFRIPVLEGVLAAKFCSRVSPLRRLPDKQQDGVDFLRIVEANEIVNFSLASLFNLVFAGATFLLFGLAVAIGDDYPTWFGWVAVAAGTLSIGAGLVQAFAGEPTGASRTLTIIGPTVITIWLLALGISLIRRSGGSSKREGTR